MKPLLRCAFALAAAVTALLGFSGCATATYLYVQQPDSAAVATNVHFLVPEVGLIAVDGQTLSAKQKFAGKTFVSPGQHEILVMLNGGDDGFIFGRATADFAAGHRYRFRNPEDDTVVLVDETDAHGPQPTIGTWNLAPGVDADTEPIYTVQVSADDIVSPPYGHDRDPHGKPGDDHHGKPGEPNNGDHHGDPGHPGGPGGDNHPHGGGPGGTNNPPGGGSGGHNNPPTHGGGGNPPHTGGGGSTTHSGGGSPPSIPNNPRPSSGGGGGGGSHSSSGGNSGGGGSHSSGGGGGGGGGGGHSSGGGGGGGGKKG